MDDTSQTANGVNFPTWDLTFPDPRHPDPKQRVTVESALQKLVICCPEIGKMASELLRVLADVPKQLRVPEELLDPLVLAPMLRLAFLVNSLPASYNAHDPKPGGLIRHSFATGLTCATNTNEMIINKLLVPPENMGWRLTLTTYYAGLVHDIGKLGFVGIRQKERNWNGIGYLSNWLDQKTGGYTLKRSPTVKYGIRNHDSYALTYLHLVLPTSIRYKIGTEMTNNIYAALTHKMIGAETYPIFDIMKSSDCQVASNPPGSLPNDIKSKLQNSVDGYVLGTSYLLDFIVTIPVISGLKTIAVNKVPGHLFVSSTHTIMLLDAAYGLSLPTAVHNYLKFRLADTVPYYLSSTPHDIVEQFNSQLANGSQSHAVIDPNGDIILRVRITAGERALSGRCMIFRNEVLWPQSNSKQFGSFSGNIKLSSTKENLATFDSEELGFSSDERNAYRFAKATEKPIATKIAPIEEMTFPGLEQVTLQLWAALSRLTPMPKYVSQVQLMDSLVRRGNLTIGESVQVLECCVDRIRFMAGSTDHTRRSHESALLPGRDIDTEQTVQLQKTSASPSAYNYGFSREKISEKITLDTDIKTRLKSGDTSSWAEYIISLYHRRREMPCPDRLSFDRPFFIATESQLLVPWPHILKPHISISEIVSTKAAAALMTKKLNGQFQELKLMFRNGDPILLQTIIIPLKVLPEKNCASDEIGGIDCYISRHDSI